MKTLHLAIIIGSGIAITTIFSVLYFFPSIIYGTTESPEAVNLDLSNSTTENPLGIKAQIVMEVDTGIMCPTKCVIPPTPHLVLTSEKGVQFVGYQVCNGISCKKDKLDNSLYVHLAQVPQNYSGTVRLEAGHINLGDLPWHVGDTVHILVKAFPVVLQPNNVVIREPEKTTVVDLGESKIIRNYSTTNVSTIIIPKYSEDQRSGKNFEPRHLVVVLGVNNTVRWINEGDVMSHVVADNQDDPVFFDATTASALANAQGIVTRPIFLKPGESFNFTFTKLGEFGYHAEPHPWLHGWVLVLPQSAENATNMVSLNTSSTIPGPCEVFRLPCPNNPNFTAQQLGANIYTEKVTVNGVDNYAVIHNSRVCVYPPSVSGSCTNPDDLAILRFVGVDTSVPQEDVNISISGLEPFYSIGQPIDFGIIVKGYGHCDVPSVLVTREGYFGWQSKAPWISCQSEMHPLDLKYDIKDLGGPFYLNQSGTYMVHVGYGSNMTEESFHVASQERPSAIPMMYANGTYSGFTINYIITGNNKLLNSTLDDKTRTVILSTHATEDGNLTVTLPPDLVNLIERGKKDSQFIVLDDGQEVVYRESWYFENMIMTIPLHSDTKKIEIIATEIV